VTNSNVIGRLTGMSAGGGLKRYAHFEFFHWDTRAPLAEKNFSPREDGRTVPGAAVSRGFSVPPAQSDSGPAEKPLPVTDGFELEKHTVDGDLTSRRAG
jgi:hypothetical protein